MDSNYPAADNTYRILRQSLEDISIRLHDWAHSFASNTPEDRMARSICAEFDSQRNFIAETLLGHLETLRPNTLINAERYVLSSFKELNISSISDVNEMRPLVHWIIEIFTITLDIGELGLDSSTADLYRQEQRLARNSLIDLEHLLVKEQQDSSLNLQLKDLLAKFSAAGIDINELARLQDRAEEQSLMFKEWIKKADQKVRDFHEAEQQVRMLAEESEAAAKSYAAAQSRLDAASEMKSSRKLVEHFQDFGQKHNLATWGFFALGILLLVGAAGYSIQFALSSELTEPTITALSWRFAMVAGSTAIGTYLLRLASYHRRLSVWADTVQVQLQTFASYTEQIGDEMSKNQLRAEFAKRVFGDEPGRATASNDKSVETMSIADLSTLIANVAKLQSKP